MSFRFIWVRHQIDKICIEKTRNGVVAALEELPVGLNEMYSQIWEKITDQNGSPRTRAMTIDILMWIYHAVRPLSPAELIEGISVVPMAPEFDTDGLTQSTILDICQNLVVFDEELRVLRFAHFSVKEFLLVKQKSAESHTKIAEVCLTLLTYHPTTSNPRALALLEYSTFNWPAHVQSSGTGSDDLKCLWSGFLKPCPAYDSWVTVVSEKNDDLCPIPGGSLPPLLIACYYQLSDIFEHLVDAGADLNDTNQHMRNSLHLAAKYGNVYAVELLLKKGMDTGVRDREAKMFLESSEGVTPISFAAGNGHERVVRILLANGVSSDNDDESVTPLWRAARGDHSKVVRVLLEAGADVNAKDRYGQSALLWGASSGSVDVVQVLLDNGASIDSQDNFQHTPLYDASYYGHEKVVKMLLVKGANVDGGPWLPPLVVAAAGGHEKVVQILLEREAKVDSKGKGGQTALGSAAEHGHEKVVEMLLAKGADVASTQDDGETPLSLARRNGHLEVAQLLTSRGAK